MKTNEKSLYQKRIDTNKSYKNENFSLSGLLRYLKSNTTNKELKILLTALKLKQSEITFDMLKGGAMASNFYLFDENLQAIALKQYFSFPFALKCLENFVEKKLFEPRKLEELFNSQVREYEANKAKANKAKANEAKANEAKADKPKADKAKANKPKANEVTQLKNVA